MIDIEMYLGQCDLSFIVQWFLPYNSKNIDGEMS